MYVEDIKSNTNTQMWVLLSLRYGMFPVLLKVLVYPSRAHPPFAGFSEETNMLNFVFVILLLCLNM